MTAVSNKDLMDAIATMQTSQNNLRLELSGKIDKVDDKVNTLATQQAVDKTKLSMLVGSISIVISAVVTVVVENLRRSV